MSPKKAPGHAGTERGKAGPELATAPAMAGGHLGKGSLTGEAGAPGSSGVADRRTITDPRTMRAVAHPVRIALLEVLGREGSLTATRAAELLDDTPGNMSWHLQTLAKYGFVEEAGGGRGRSRPWRLKSLSRRFDTAMTSPAQATAGNALEASVLERDFQGLRDWWVRRRSLPVKWRKAAFTSTSTTYLTAEELERLSDDMLALLRPYQERLRDRKARPKDGMPVRVVTFAHPLPPTSTGN